MENADPNAVPDAVSDAVLDAVPGADVAAATNTSLPPFTGGNKVYPGERWLPMVMDHWRLAWRVENATYMYLLQKGRSVASLRCENWSHECHRYLAMLLSAASREDKFVLEALWNAYNPRQVYDPINAWLQDQKKTTSVKTAEVDRTVLKAEEWLAEYEQNTGQTMSESSEMATKQRKRTMTEVRNEDLDLWRRAFRPLFWRKNARTHIACTSTLWQNSVNNRTYLERLIAQQHAEKIQRMSTQPAGLLMEHTMRVGAYGEAFDGNLIYINGCGIGDKRMKLDELPYECVRKTYVVSSSDASWLGKTIANVVYMPPAVAEEYGKHDLEWASMMEPVKKKAGEVDVPMDSPAVSAEAKKNMEEVFEKCTETVGMCERVYALVHCYKTAVKAEDHARARFWREQLGSYMPDHLPAA